MIDQVYQRLLEAIGDVTLQPGQRIRQSELANMLGVSRQPVSHALHLLKRQGLVQDSGRKGFEVTPIDPDRIRQLYEVRAAMDSLAARLAARRIASAQAPASLRGAVQDALSAGRALAPDCAMQPLIHADVAFHRALYRLSGNPAIEEMIGPHWPHLTRSMAVVLEEPGYRAHAWAEHAEILRRVFDGDAQGAVSAAHDHAEKAWRTTCARFAETAAVA